MIMEKYTPTFGEWKDENVKYEYGRYMFKEEPYTFLSTVTKYKQLYEVEP